MLRSRFVALSLALGILPFVSRADCVARDFMVMPLPAVLERLPQAIALELAYPGLTVVDVQRKVHLGEAIIPLGEKVTEPARARLSTPTILDQFAQVYPLDFELNSRKSAWFDPGRVRNEEFMKALYGSTESEVAEGLVRVDYTGTGRRARFAVTQRQCVAQQLAAALEAIAAEGADMDVYFANVGGSFNWRVISGTGRLSAHSFGMAVDFNTHLGQYWKWSGAQEGNVGAYDNRYPEKLVRHMERFGFVWGGKWHHYDGMHFEYRPELILHARLVTET